MSEMVERLARAIWPAWVDEPCFRERCLQQARAGIKAMREPTKEMLMSSGLARTQKDKWQAMIDEALK